MSNRNQKTAEQFKTKESSVEIVISRELFYAKVINLFSEQTDEKQ